MKPFFFFFIVAKQCEKLNFVGGAHLKAPSISNSSLMILTNKLSNPDPIPIIPVYWSSLQSHTNTHMLHTNSPLSPRRLRSPSLRKMAAGGAYQAVRRAVTGSGDLWDSHLWNWLKCKALGPPWWETDGLSHRAWILAEAFGAYHLSLFRGFSPVLACVKL